jgi:quinol monooxygenase YgiN
MAVTTVRVTIKFDPSDSQTFLDALRELWQQARLEDDLLYFDLSESVTNPGTFYLIEIWARDIEYLQNVRLLSSVILLFHWRHSQVSVHDDE